MTPPQFHQKAVKSFWRRRCQHLVLEDYSRERSIASSPGKNSTSSTWKVFLNQIILGTRASIYTKTVKTPALWNSFPFHVRNSTSVTSFRKHLKTHLSSCSPPPPPPPTYFRSIWSHPQLWTTDLDHPSTNLLINILLT